MLLQPTDRRNIFPLIPLNPFDQHHRLFLPLRFSALGSGGFRFFLGGVFGGAFLGVDGEGGEGGGDCFCGEGALAESKGWC